MHACPRWHEPGQPVNDLKPTKFWYNLKAGEVFVAFIASLTVRDKRQTWYCRQDTGTLTVNFDQAYAHVCS